MKTYASEYSLDYNPAVGQAVKLLSAVVVIGSLVACYVTAGPGNAYAYALAAKPGTERIELPRMEVIGSRTAEGQSVASVSCSKGA